MTKIRSSLAIYLRGARRAPPAASEKGAPLGQSSSLLQRRFHDYRWHNLDDNVNNNEVVDGSSHHSGSGRVSVGGRASGIRHAWASDVSASAIATRSSAIVHFHYKAETSTSTSHHSQLGDSNVVVVLARTVTAAAAANTNNGLFGMASQGLDLIANGSFLFFFGCSSKVSSNL